MLRPRPVQGGECSLFDRHAPLPTTSPSPRPQACPRGQASPRRDALLTWRQLNAATGPDGDRVPPSSWKHGDGNCILRPGCSWANLCISRGGRVSRRSLYRRGHGLSTTQGQWTDNTYQPLSCSRTILQYLLINHLK